MEIEFKKYKAKIYTHRRVTFDIEVRISDPDTAFWFGRCWEQMSRGRIDSCTSIEVMSRFHKGEVSAEVINLNIITSEGGLGIARAICTVIRDKIALVDRLERSKN